MGYRGYRGADFEPAERVVREVVATGGEAFPLRLPVDSLPGVEQVIGNLTEHWGRLDFVVDLDYRCQFGRAALPWMPWILVEGGEGNRPLPPRIWGEICLRGPNVMLGYWKRPAETADALRGGWLRTGDIGYLDEDGSLYIVDRTKDMINAAGFKIWPREVEEILYQHPAIKECAVVGVPDAIKGEAAKTYVVLKPGVTLTAEALEAYCHAHMATYKVPHLYEFITELPKNPAGKILKRVLRDQASRLPVLA